MKYKLLDKEDVSIGEITMLFKAVWEQTQYHSIESKTKWAFDNTFSKILLYRDKEKLIAARGGIYWPLNFGEKELKVIQFHGTCVHPDYRRKGIFTSINKDYLKECIHENVDIIFNVSVDTSRDGYEKLGWHYIKGFRRLTFIRKPLKVFFNSGKSQFTKKNAATYSEVIIPNSFNESRNKHLKEEIHCKYTTDFLQWRLSNKNENYKTIQTSNGLILYKTNIKKNNFFEVIIGEVFLLKYNFTNFSEVLKVLIKKENPDILYTYIFTGHPCYWYFIKCLFMPNPKRYNLNFGFNVLNSGLKNNITNKKWAISFLDIDTF